MKNDEPRTPQEVHAYRVEQRELLKERLVWEREKALVETLVLCAEPLHMRCTGCHDELEVERGCNKRWCPVCGPRITAARLERFSWAASQMQWPLAVTLTTLNRPEAEGAIRHLRKALSRFRRTKLFSHNVTGGIVSIEVTNTGKGWHVHAHLLIDCRWLAIETPEPASWHTPDQKAALCKRAHIELSHHWAWCLKQEEAVTWVERSWGKALQETVKYAVKPTTLLECVDHIGPIIREMHRTQLCNGFGTMYRVAKKMHADLDALKPVCECKGCGSIKSYRPEAMIIMDTKRREPLWCNRPPSPPVAPVPHVRKSNKKGGVLIGAYCHKQDPDYIPY